MIHELKKKLPKEQWNITTLIETVKYEISRKKKLIK